MHQVFFHRDSDIAALLAGSKQAVPVVYGPINKVIPKFPELKSIFAGRRLVLMQNKPGEPLHLALLLSPWTTDDECEVNGVDHTDTLSRLITKSGLAVPKTEIEFSEMDLSGLVGYIAKVSFELFHMELDVDLRDKELLFFGQSGDIILFKVEIDEEEILQRFKDIDRYEGGAICVCFSIEQSSSRKLNVGPFKQPTKRGHL